MKIAQKQVDEIVVFRQFDNSIDANIIKTKLDAFDIPCFLTDENITNLYPGLQYGAVGLNVRLHLFAADVPMARKILEENHLMLEDDSVTICPRCHSRNIERDFSQNFLLRFFSVLAILLMVIPVPQKKVYRCMSCENEFN